MRILFISYFFPPDKSVGGLRAASLMQHFPEKDIDMTLITAETTLEKSEILRKELGDENVFLAEAPKLREIGYKTKLLSLIEILNLEHYLFFPDIWCTMC